MDLNEYLNTPIQRKVALSIVVGQGVANFIIASRALRKHNRRAKAIIVDLNERLNIYDESLDFLLKRADDATILELNRDLDFWRVVRKMPPRES